VIERIDNIGVGVSDLDRALDFYRRLGFEVLEQEAETPSATLQAGSVRLWVFRGGGSGVTRREPDPAANPPGLDHLSLWVEDVDVAHESLRGQGLEFESEPADQPWGARATSLVDPDGTRIYLLGPLRQS
jgi:catechol 2,3-dioxygenase-like lactoylglutathione lyase family enzyme